MKGLEGWLALTRSKGESILIGDGIEVCVSRVKTNGRVVLAVRAPRGVLVLRKELLDKEPKNG